MTTDVSMSWRLTWAGNTYTAKDMRVSDALAVRSLLGVSGPEAWRAMSPLTDPQTCAAFLAVLVARANGGDLGAAVSDVFGAPAVALIEALDVDDDD